MFATKNAMDSSRRTNRPTVTPEEQAQIEQRRIATKEKEEVNALIKGGWLCIERNGNNPTKLRQCMMGNINHHQSFFVGPRKYTNEEGIRQALTSLANQTNSDMVRNVLHEILSSPSPLSTLSIPMEDIQAYNEQVKLEEAILQFRHSVMLCIMKNKDAYKLKQCIMGLILGKNVQQRTDNYWNKRASREAEREVIYREALNSILAHNKNSTLMDNYQNYQTVEINQDTIQRVLTDILNIPKLAKYSITTATQKNMQNKWTSFRNLFRGGKTRRRRPRKRTSFSKSKSK